MRVAGRLEEAAARELRQVCSHSRGVLIIDLVDLISADRPAIQTLRELRAAGARIVGASPYIALMLNAGPEDPAMAPELDKD